MITLVLILLGITFLPHYLFPCKQVMVNIDRKELQKLSKDQNEIRKSLDSGGNVISTRAGNFIPYPTRQNKSPMYSRKKDRQRRIVEINTADTTAFIDLPGIGSTLASRIVLFREKLGGFINVKQIGEVYGLRDSVFQLILPYLRCDSGKIKKLHINIAGKEELKSHPYIRWSIAAMLVNYRTHHGPFRSIDDLRKIENLEDSALNKLIPYLWFGESE